MAFLGAYNNMVEAYLDMNKEHDEEVYRKRLNIAEELIDRATSNLNANTSRGGDINITININVNSLKDIETEQVKDLVTTINNEINNQLSISTSPTVKEDNKVEEVIEVIEEKPKRRKRKQLEP